MEPTREELDELCGKILRRAYTCLEMNFESHPAWVNRALPCDMLPLEIALAMRDAECVRLLFRHGADVDAISPHEDMSVMACVMVEACYERDMARLQVLLDAGYSPDSKLTYVMGEPILHRAAATSYELTKLLLARGANVHLRDTDGTTALMVACYLDAAGYQNEDGPRIVETLLDAGVDPHATSDSGNDAMSIIRKQGSNHGTRERIMTILAARM